MGFIVSKVFWDFYIFFIFTRPLRFWMHDAMVHSNLLRIRFFPYFWSHRVFILRIQRYCASYLCTTFPLMSFRITSLHLSFGVPMLRCQLTSISHVLITRSSVFLSMWPNHLSLAGPMFSLMYATPGLALMFLS